MYCCLALPLPGAAFFRLPARIRASLGYVPRARGDALYLSDGSLDRANPNRREGPLPLETIDPVARTPALMRDGEDKDQVRLD